MQKSIFNAALVAVVAMAMNVACAKKNKGSEVPEKSNNEILNSVFKASDSRFDASNSALADRIDSVELESVFGNGSANGAIGSVVGNISFSVTFKGQETPITLKSGEIAKETLTSGSRIKLAVSDEAQAAAGADGYVTAEAQCLDTHCGEIALLVKSYKEESVRIQQRLAEYTPAMAGYIFTNEKGEDKVAIYQQAKTETAVAESTPVIRAAGPTGRNVE